MRWWQSQNVADTAAAKVDAQLKEPTTSQHDDIAAGTAAGVAKAHENAAAADNHAGKRLYHWMLL